MMGEKQRDFSYPSYKHPPYFPTLWIEEESLRKTHTGRSQEEFHMQ